MDWLSDGHHLELADTLSYQSPSAFEEGEEEVPDVDHNRLVAHLQLRLRRNHGQSPRNADAHYLMMPEAKVGGMTTLGQKRMETVDGVVAVQAL
jgi:hypothetical protein